MPWIYLFLAGLFEVGWAIGLKYTENFSRFWPSMFTLWAMGISFYLLSLAMKSIPVGTAYAVWTGIGAIGTALLGMILFDEPKTTLRFLCLALIISGVVGLRLVNNK